MTGPLFPENYSKIWIRGRFITMAGVAVRGKLTLAPTVTGGGLVNRSLKLIMSAAAFSADTDNDGYVALQVPATNDPDITPINFTYAVTTPIGQKFSIVVPYDTTPLNSVGDPLHGQPVIELIDMVPVGSSGGVGQLLRGIGIQSMVDNGAGGLLVTYSDLSTTTIAMPDTVAGPPGPAGPAGPVGPEGPTGPAGGGATNLVDLADIDTAGAAVGQDSALRLLSAGGFELVPGAIIVEAFRESGDPDDTLSWQRAVTAAVARGSKRIHAQKSTYACSGPIDLKGLNGVVISGLGTDSTVITVNGGASAVDAFFYTTGTCSGITIQDMTIQGTISESVTGPSRPRVNVGGAGSNAGVKLVGNRNPDESTREPVKDIRLRRLKIAKMNVLPFLLDGIDGYAQVMDFESYLTMDASWVFCERVIFDNIRSVLSADNGFSISRGNAHVTGGTIFVDRCAYYGLWVSGWLVDGNTNDTGPKNWVIDTLHVTRAGMGGLKLDDAPSLGRINNIFVNDIPRGSLDEPTAAGGLGILIGGNPSQPNRNTVAAYAEDFSIGSATLISCARGGILISGGARRITIDDVHILDAGAQYDVDGTTVITAGRRDTNFGIAVLQTYETSVSDIMIRNARVVDRRATPYTNYPIDLAGALTSGYAGLTTKNCRQPANADSIAESYGGVKTFKQRILSGAPTCTIAAGAQATTAAAASSGCNDICGTVNATAAASPAAGLLLTVSFGTAYVALPRVVISPTNQASADCRPYVSNRGLTSFQISAANAPAASASLQFDYHVLG